MTKGQNKNVKKLFNFNFLDFPYQYFDPFLVFYFILNIHLKMLLNCLLLTLNAS